MANGFPPSRLMARVFNRRSALRRRWNAASGLDERPASARERTEVEGRKMEAEAVDRRVRRRRKDLMVTIIYFMQQAVICDVFFFLRTPRVGDLRYQPRSLVKK
jgi:hypothetical protein